MSAPARRASADVQIAIAGQALTLRFSAKALAALQDHWRLENLDQVGLHLVELETGGIQLSDYTAILWAALRTHHPAVTIEEALDLLDEMGVATFETTLLELLSGSSPSPSEGGGNASGGPRRRGRSSAS